MRFGDAVPAAAVDGSSSNAINGMAADDLALEIISVRPGNDQPSVPRSWSRVRQSYDATDEEVGRDTWERR